MVIAEYPNELIHKFKELLPHDNQLHQMLDTNNVQAWDKLIAFHESFNIAFVEMSRCLKFS